jgi:hypothetical protein
MSIKTGVLKNRFCFILAFNLPLCISANLVPILRQL